MIIIVKKEMYYIWNTRLMRLSVTVYLRSAARLHSSINMFHKKVHFWRSLTLIIMIADEPWPHIKAFSHFSLTLYRYSAASSGLWFSVLTSKAGYAQSYAAADDNPIDDEQPKGIQVECRVAVGRLSWISGCEVAFGTEDPHITCNNGITIWTTCIYWICIVISMLPRPSYRSQFWS